MKDHSSNYGDISADWLIKDMEMLLNLDIKKFTEYMGILHKNICHAHIEAFRTMDKEKGLLEGSFREYFFHSKDYDAQSLKIKKLLLKIVDMKEVREFCDDEISCLSEDKELKKILKLQKDLNVMYKPVLRYLSELFWCVNVNFELWAKKQKSAMQCMGGYISQGIDVDKCIEKVLDSAEENDIKRYVEYMGILDRHYYSALLEAFGAMDKEKGLAKGSFRKYFLHCKDIIADNKMIELMNEERENGSFEGYSHQIEERVINELYSDNYLRKVLEIPETYYKESLENFNHLFQNFLVYSFGKFLEKDVIETDEKSYQEYQEFVKQVEISFYDCCKNNSNANKLINEILANLRGVSEIELEKKVIEYMETLNKRYCRVFLETCTRMEERLCLEKGSLKNLILYKKECDKFPLIEEGNTEIDMEKYVRALRELARYNFYRDENLRETLKIGKDKYSKIIFGFNDLFWGYLINYMPARE